MCLGGLAQENVSECWMNEWECVVCACSHSVPLRSPWSRHCRPPSSLQGGKDRRSGIEAGQRWLEREGSQASARNEANLRLPLLPLQESISSSGTPHKRDSFIYSTWLEDSVSTTSGGSSPGTRPGAAAPQAGPSNGRRGQGWAQRGETTSHAPGGGYVTGDSGWFVIQSKMIGWLGGLVSSRRVLEDDGEAKGESGWGALGEECGGFGEHQPVPTAHPCPPPWCLPAASEVALSCPPPQAPHGHPIQTPASWGTLHVQRSRSSWKGLSTTHPSWYVQPQWSRGPLGQEGLGSSVLGTASDFCLPVSSAHVIICLVLCLVVILCAGLLARLPSEGD